MKERFKYALAGAFLISSLLLAVFFWENRAGDREETPPQPAEIGESPKELRVPAVPVVKQPTPAKVAKTKRKEPNIRSIREPSIDPDLELVKGFLSKPLPLGTLEARREVDSRMKNREKAVADLIKSDVIKGKVMRAYLVKQPSPDELREIMKPLALYRNAQAKAEDKRYVDEMIQAFGSALDVSSGDYKLLYALIPKDSGSIECFAYGATDEQNALDILNAELNPKPRQVGVPYTPRDGHVEVVRNAGSSWRMDHLFTKDEVGHVKNY